MLINIPHKRLILVLLLIILITLPLLLWQLGKQQEVRQRASGATISLSVTGATKTVGETFDVPVILKGGTYNITGIDADLTLDKDILEFVSFQPSTIFNSSLINSYNPSVGQLRFVLVDTTATTITGDITLGTLRLGAKAPGTGTVVFQNNPQVVSLGTAGLLTVANNENGSFTIKAPSPTPPVPTDTPLPPISGTPAPTVTPTITPTDTPAPSITLTPIPSLTQIPTQIPTNVPSPSPTGIQPTPTPSRSDGDIGGDGKVDLNDFVAWKIEFLQELNGGTSPKTADLNNDGAVTLDDFVIWKIEFLRYLGL